MPGIVPLLLNELGVLDLGLLESLAENEDHYGGPEEGEDAGDHEGHEDEGIAIGEGDLGLAEEAVVRLLQEGEVVCLVDVEHHRLARLGQLLRQPLLQLEVARRVLGGRRGARRRAHEELLLADGGLEQTGGHGRDGPHLCLDVRKLVRVHPLHLVVMRRDPQHLHEVVFRVCLDVLVHPLQVLPPLHRERLEVLPVPVALLHWFVSVPDLDETVEHLYVLSVRLALTLRVKAEFSLY